MHGRRRACSIGRASGVSPAAAASPASSATRPAGRWPALRVLAVAAGGDDAGESVTDDDGFYLVSLLRPGRYALLVGFESALASRFGVRGVDVAPGAVARLDVDAPRAGATVRVRALAPDGAALAAQAILVAGPPGSPSSVRHILASDAIRLPELGDGRLVLTHVPPGVYTLVLLRGPEQPPIAAAAPVRVGDEREIALDVRLPDEAAPRS